MATGFISRIGARIWGKADEGDETLHACRQQIAEIQERITSVKTQFEQYSHAAQTSCEASSLLSKSCTMFFKDMKDCPVQSQIKQYADNQDATATRVVSIFHQALNGEDGVIHDLDKWMEVLRHMLVQIDECERLGKTADTTQKRLQTLQAKKTGGGRGRNRTSSLLTRNDVSGASFGDGTPRGQSDLDAKISELEQHYKLFQSDFENSREEISTRVTNIMDKRVDIFNRVFTKILKCQIAFNNETNALSDEYRPIIDGSSSFKPPSFDRNISVELLGIDRQVSNSNSFKTLPGMQRQRSHSYSVGDRSGLNPGVSNKIGLTDEKSNSPQPPGGTDTFFDLFEFTQSPVTTPTTAQRTPQFTQSVPVTGSGGLADDPLGIFGSGSGSGNAVDDIFGPMGSSNAGIAVYPSHTNPPNFTPATVNPTPEPSPVVRQPRPTGPVAEPTEEEWEAAHDRVAAQIHEWEYSNGQRKNIRALLSRLDTIIFDGVKWKCVGMSDILQEKKLKKAYRKAITAFHPDKISLNRGFTVDQVALAEGIFLGLTEAWQEHEGTQG